MVKTINISVNDADLRKIDDYCACHNLTRSKFILSAAIEKVMVDDLVNGLALCQRYLAKADRGVLSDSDNALLERAVALIGGSANG